MIIRIIKCEKKIPTKKSPIKKTINFIDDYFLLLMWPVFITGGYIYQYIRDYLN